MHRCSIAPSTYYDYKQRQQVPSPRATRDAELKELIKDAFEANYRVYGARKIRREAHRQGHPVVKMA